MGKLSKNKGRVGEREWAKRLREAGYTKAHRSQQFKGSSVSADVLAPGCPVANWEVKRRERLSLHPVVEQARQEAPVSELSAVAWRKDNGRWVVSMDADDFLKMLRDA